MKVLRFFSKISKCVCMVLVLLLLSLLLVSYKISKETIINPYCICNYENEEIDLDYKEIINYNYKFNCSTLYIHMKVIPTIDKQEILSLLLSIATQIKEYKCFTHFEVNSDSLNKTLYVSIDLNTLTISYVGG